jgi:hypothetical protein
MEMLKKKKKKDQYIGLGHVSAEWLDYTGSQVISQAHH